VSGHVGNLVMGQVTTKLQEMESQQAKEQEQKVSPDVSYNIAAKQLSARASTSPINRPPSWGRPSRSVWA